MGPFRFELVKTDGAARLGRMLTAHGPGDTPAFMPVATQGSVKSLAPSDRLAAGAQIVLANTYHLMLRPGPELGRLPGLQPLEAAAHRGGGRRVPLPRRRLAADAHAGVVRGGAARPGRRR